MSRERQRKAAPSVPRRPAVSERLSPVAENYLFSLYQLREEGKRLTMAQMAAYLKRIPVSEGLGTSLPSVAGMVRRMVREGLLSLSPDKEIRLTERGEVLAQDIVRRHRLAERLVVDMLGMELHQAHIEAHRLEHAISPELMAKIVERLGNPSASPFGRPIPGAGPLPAEDEAVTLDQADPGKAYLVDRVPEDDHDLLRFLVESGVVPNAEVRVREAAAYRGVLTFTVSGRDVALGYEVASLIRVRPAER